jgi:hypothetical protein
MPGVFSMSTVVSATRVAPIAGDLSGGEIERRLAYTAGASAKESILTVTLPLPFCASRGVDADDPLFGAPGVALEVVGLELDDDLEESWRRRVAQAARHLGWPEPTFAVVMAAGRHLLGYTAPTHQLLTAREANEWAWCAAVVARDPGHWGALCEALRAAASATEAAGATVPLLAEIDEPAALHRLACLARAEAETLQPA